jgi:hypothetical protein
VFENRVLGRILGPKSAEAIRSRKNLHNEELHNLYLPLDNFSMIKAGRMRWAGHVPPVG